MGSYFEAIDRFAVALARAVIRFRWLVILVAFLVAVGLGSGGRFLEFSNNYRVFFSQENPELQAFEALQANYTKNDNFTFIIESDGSKAFSPETLSAVEWLTAEAWQIPFAIRVDSITNFQSTHSVEDDLIVEDLVRHPETLSEAVLAQKQTIALAEPLLREQLITPDGKVTAVNVVLQYPEKGLNEVPEAAEKARSLRDQLKQQFPNLRIHLTGVSMLNNAFAEAGISDLSSLVPAMFLAIALLTFVVLRSSSSTVITVIVIALSSMVGMGVGGFLGIKLTPVSGSAPIVILTLAVADSIHILITLRGLMCRGVEKLEAVVEAIRVNFLPVSITSVTTIIGFMSLNFSDAPPFWHLGNMTAIGIAAAWIFSMTLLPALVSILPYRVQPRASGNTGTIYMDRLADYVIARPKQLLVSLGLMSVILIAFIPAIEFNDQWIEYFDEDIEFRRDSDQASKYFGMYPIEFSLPAKEAGGVSEPEYLQNLERFTDFLRQQPQVKHVYSLTDIMKRLNKNMHSDDSGYYRVPDNRELSAQYLLLYELSLPYGLDLNDRITIDKSATRVTATLGRTDTLETKRFLADTDRWVQENLPTYMRPRPTGAQVMFTYITERNVNSMIVGTVTAIAAIAVILVLTLRSLSLGVLSLVPNGLPILATFGAWAILVGEVGFSIATVASISLGIIVDDTVHFLSKFVRARRESGLSTADSIRYAFHNVGVAILVNTIILAIGFAILMTSSFKINADMGLLTALAIIFALVLDFLFLPALLLVFDRKGRASTRLDTPIASGDSTMNQEQTQSFQAASPNSSLKTIASALIMLGAVSSALVWAPDVSAEPTVTSVRGETPEERKGFEIAARSDRTDRGFGDSKVSLKMVLRNAAGKESIRQLKITTLEVEDESIGDRSKVLFDHPRDIKGTALLSHAKILDPDDQWLFLPALKRVKRISSSNKSGPFVGSEFAFEDFTSLELNKYDYRWLREEPCGEFTCDVSERYPRYEYSGYSKQIAWTDQSVYQVRKVEFYNRRGDLLKTLTMKDYRAYGDIWRAQILAMVNHQTGKSTDLIYDEYVFNVGLKNRDFVKNALTKVR